MSRKNSYDLNDWTSAAARLFLAKAFDVFLPMGVFSQDFSRQFGRVPERRQWPFAARRFPYTRLPTPFCWPPYPLRGGLTIPPGTRRESRLLTPASSDSPISFSPVPLVFVDMLAADAVWSNVPRRWMRYRRL